jgi:hypothetical protein
MQLTYTELNIKIKLVGLIRFWDFYSLLCFSSSPAPLTTNLIAPHQHLKSKQVITQYKLVFYLAHPIISLPVTKLFMINNP